jgi:hypothetical protein
VWREQGLLLCPARGFTYLRHVQATIYERRGDEENADIVSLQIGSDPEAGDNRNL